MFANDLLLAFLFMALLFLRQIAILKQPNKINYAPLMIGIGVISSVVHFIIHPENQNAILLLRESFFPILVSLLLYIVLNILHQTQESESARTQDDFLRVLVSEISGLKDFMSDLENRVSLSQQEDQKVQEAVRQKFKDDIKALNEIKINQDKFAIKFKEMEVWHDDVSEGFAHFTEVQLPELDNVVHKHIDILRVAEQDHYNQIKLALNKAAENKVDVSDELEELKQKLGSMKTLSEDIAKSITKHTLEQLSGLIKSFEVQINSLKSQSEAVKTSLDEGESTLDSIRSKSELIMKQMILSSKKMSELEKQSSGLHDIHSDIKGLLGDIEMVKSDYVKSQSQLNMISKEIAASKDEKIDVMKEQIDSLGVSLSKKVDESLEKLHEHYHIADDDITQSVQRLSQKAKFKKGYGEFES